MVSLARTIIYSKFISLKVALQSYVMGRLNIANLVIYFHSIIVDGKVKLLIYLTSVLMDLFY